MNEYIQHLKDQEKSPKTIEKYAHDIKIFNEFVGALHEAPANEHLTKNDILNYKSHLAKHYSLTTANSMLASLNSYLKFIGRENLIVKQFKLQKKTYCPEEKELTKAEYLRLLKAARSPRLNLIIQTICGTGIRISELKYITTDSVKHGEFTVSCKNKTRTVFIVRELQKKLLTYIKQNNITGTVFVTKTGKPIDRTNIWREMKKLCIIAKVAATKVFPHNLRHLFARTFYSIEKDIAKLADILGHSSIDTTRIYIITTGAEHR